MQRKTINGIDLAFADLGDGPAVVLVHGFPLDHTMWDAQIDDLSKNCRAIAPDLRGFGRSQVTEGTVTMDQMAGDLAALLDSLEIAGPIVLCGLSMGGYVALTFQRKYPARLRGLILCDTRAVADTAEVAAGRREMADRVVSEGPAPLVETMMPKLFAQSTVNEHPQVVESLRQVMLATDPHGIAAAARGMAERPDVTETLAKIDCPTLVLAGEHDAISTPAEMIGLAGVIPGAKFVEIAASGHMSPMEKPADVTAAIEAFLAHENLLG